MTDCPYCTYHGDYARAAQQTDKVTRLCQLLDRLAKAGRGVLEQRSKASRDELRAAIQAVEDYYDGYAEGERKECE